MRIGLMVRNLSEKGGIAVYARALVENLLAIDAVNEYTIYYGDEASLGAFRDRPNVTEVLLPCRNKLWWDQVQVAGDANRRGLDLVYGPKMSLPFFFRGHKSLALHGGEQFVFPHEFDLVDRAYVRIFLPLYARAADLIITPAVSSRDDLARELRVPTDRFLVVPHGTKTIYFEPVSEERRLEVRRRYGLEGEFLLHVGLIWGAKNFEILPAVLDRLGATRPMILAHAGKPHRWSDAAAAFPSRDDIRELGYVPDEDLAALYQAATAFVFPSLYEGFGIPLVEALAAGCPVVTTAWGAMREICEGVALLVDSRDPDAIAAAVLRFTQDAPRREEYARLGRERAAGLTWRITAERTLAGFEELHAGSRRRATREPRAVPPAPLPSAPGAGPEGPIPTANPGPLAPGRPRWSGNAPASPIPVHFTADRLKNPPPTADSEGRPG